MAIADDFAAIAAGMRRNAWKARKLVSFRCDALPREVPAELAHPFVAVDIDKPLTEADITSIAARLRLEISGDDRSGG